MTPKLDFMATLKGLRSGDIRVGDLPEAAVTRLTEMMGIDRPALEARYAAAAARERAAPRPGDRAPDFTLERLDAGGGRTGELVTLSHHLERPIALIFGSYT